MILEVTMERVENRQMTSPYDWELEQYGLIVYRPIYSHARHTGWDGLPELLPLWGPPREVRC